MRYFDSNDDFIAIDDRLNLNFLLCLIHLRFIDTNTKNYLSEKDYLSEEFSFLSWFNLDWPMDDVEIRLRNFLKINSQLLMPSVNLNYIRAFCLYSFIQKNTDIVQFLGQLRILESYEIWEFNYLRTILEEFYSSSIVEFVSFCEWFLFFFFFCNSNKSQI